MKARLLTLPLVCFTVLTLSAVSARSQTVVTFDDLQETGSGSWFSLKYQGYQGLIWNNVLCNNAILFTNVLAKLVPGVSNGLSGNYYGMVSASNVAGMAGAGGLGPNSEIDSPGTHFDFFSAYLTGNWNSNVNIEVQGFNGAKEIYDTIVVASATNATLFTFDYLNIDRLYFNAYGGQPAFDFQGADYLFTMDNFMFEFIPEPSPLLLTALGAVTLLALRKRFRA